MTETDWLKSMLREWGSYMLTEERGVIGLGYPEQSIGAESMTRPIKRTQDEQDRVNRLKRAARRPKVRTRDGGREKVEHMIPLAQPHDTRSRRGTTPLYEPWPADVRKTHNAVGMLPTDEQQALLYKYVYQVGRPTAAQEMRITQQEYREMVARAEGAVRTLMMQSAA